MNFVGSTDAWHGLKTSLFFTWLQIIQATSCSFFGQTWGSQSSASLLLLLTDHAATKSAVELASWPMGVRLSSILSLLKNPHNPSTRWWYCDEMPTRVSPYWSNVSQIACECEMKRILSPFLVTVNEVLRLALACWSCSRVKLFCWVRKLKTVNWIWIRCGWIVYSRVSIEIHVQRRIQNQSVFRDFIFNFNFFTANIISSRTILPHYHVPAFIGHVARKQMTTDIKFKLGTVERLESSSCHIANSVVVDLRFTREPNERQWDEQQIGRKKKREEKKLNSKCRWEKKVKT